MPVRVTAITGAGSGIGLATRLLLESRGECVVGIDLRGAEIEADLSTRQGRDLALGAVGSRCTAGLDAVIACAGISPPADGDRIISVNFFGAVAILEGLLPLLSNSANPRAVAISSIASILPSDKDIVAACLLGNEAEARRRAPANASMAYASSKLALTHWIRRTAVLPAWARAGVLLNGIAPGTVKTPMAAPLLASEEGRKKLSAAIPVALPDYAPPEDVAPVLAFLAGPDNRFMVGQVPFVDGGTEILRRGEAAFP